jgi:hypothetical protein
MLSTGSARRRGARLAVVAGIVTAQVLLRQPLALARPQFIWEEAAAFWATTFTFDPVPYLVQPWAGYFQIIPRAAFLVARLGPPELAPAVTFATHAIIIGFVAAFLASDRMATAIPDRRIRVAFGVSIGLLPFAEAYLSVLSIQWFLALMLVGLSLSPPRRWDYPVIVLAGLSGIGAVLALPLFWRDRRGLALLAVAAVQGVVVLSSGRLSGSLHVEPISLLIMAVVVIVLLVPRTLPLRTRLAFGYLAIVTLGAAVFTFGIGGRYSLAASAAIVFGRDRRNSPAPPNGRRHSGARGRGYRRLVAAAVGHRHALERARPLHRRADALPRPGRA